MNFFELVPQDTEFSSDLLVTHLNVVSLKCDAPFEKLKEHFTKLNSEWTGKTKTVFIPSFSDNNNTFVLFSCNEYVCVIEGTFVGEQRFKEYTDLITSIFNSVNFNTHITYVKG